MKKLVTLTVLVLLLSVWVIGPVSACDGTGSITVHKFHDVNRNSVQDAGEEDIEGWLIRIYRYDETGLYKVAEGYTDADGMITFDNLPSPTQYKAWEEERDCWEPTTPNLSDYVWDGGRYTIVWLNSNETVSVEFGNVYTCYVPCYESVDETAWVDGVRYTPRGNWGTYTPYVPDSTVTLYAGQTMNAGSVHFSAPDNDNNVTITINLADNWEFAPVEENVKIQDYTSAPPSGNPRPGRFAWKETADGQSFSITVPWNNFYGVHVDVDYLMEVTCPVP